MFLPMLRLQRVTVSSRYTIGASYQANFSRTVTSISMAHSLWPCEPQLFSEGCDEFQHEVAAKTLPTEQELHPHASPSLLSGFSPPALSLAGAKAINTKPLPSVKRFKSGSFNHLYELGFEKNSLIARLPIVKNRLRRRLDSEVATMTFAHHVLGIPTPESLAWNPSVNNPVRSPYILMTKEPGIDGESLWYEKLDESQKKVLLKSFAAFHSKLATPLPYSDLGSLYFSSSSQEPHSFKSYRPSDPSCYTVGPAILSPHERREAQLPPTSASTDLKSLWQGLFRREQEAFFQRWPPSTPLDTVLDPDDETHQITMGRVMNVSTSLEALISKWEPSPDWPDHYLAPCLSMSDYGFRNFLVDENTLEITSVLDWESYHVRPFLFSTLFPDDICSTWFQEEWPDPLDLGFDFLPPDEDPYAPKREEDPFRQERLDHTRYRRDYLAFLRELDARFDDDLLWEARKDPLKIQYIVSRSCQDTWTVYAEWIDKTLAKVVASAEK